MDTVTQYQEIVESVLLEYAKCYAESGSIQTETVFDEKRHHYLLLDIGWNEKHRIHHVIIHLDIIDGKIWIQEDNTEEGVALDLENNGVTKDKIVLGFKSPYLRQFTEYAAA